MGTYNTTNFAPRGQYHDRTTSAVFQIEQWDDAIFRLLDKTFIMKSTVSEVPSAKISGKIYHQPKVGRLKVNNVSVGNPVALQAYTEDEFSMNFKRYQESSFAIHDVANIFLDYDVRSEYQREVAYALSQDCDNWILGYRTVLKKAGNVVTAKDTGGVNSPLNRAAILAAKLLMDRQDVPQDDRMWIFSPSQLISLLTIPEFVSGDYVQGMPTVTGQVGTLYGYPVMINNNILKNSLTGLQIISGVNGAGVRTFTNVPTPGVTDGVSVVSPYYPASALNGDINGAGQETLVVTDTLTIGAYSGMLVRKGWLKFGYAQMPKTEIDRETSHLSDIVVCSTLYDAKVYRPEFGVVLESFETV